MNLLLDTHAFLWFCQDDPNLSAAAKSMIENPANRKLVSVASCWEIAIKAGLGKLKLGESSAAYIPAALARTGFELLPISIAHALEWSPCRSTIAIRSIAFSWSRPSARDSP